MEINQTKENPSDQGKTVSLEQKRNRLKSKRSNSFDVSILNGSEPVDQQSESAPQPGPSNWFVKRHQPMSTKNETNDKIVSKVEVATVTIANETQQPSSSSSAQEKERKLSNAKDSAKVVWDGRSGSLVDAEALGSAIEVFLRRGGAPETSTPPPAATTSGVSPSKGAIPKTSHAAATKPTSGKSKSTSGWYSNKETDDDTTDSCDTSLCSTLKDLFVK
ncbi:kairos [Carabus blaptoides fortunei]